jgi:hypothetical protein
MSVKVAYSLRVESGELRVESYGMLQFVGGW